MEAFIESGMTFGPYREGDCFRIETSAVYQAIQQNLQMAEFLLLRNEEGKPPVVWIVEAKQSSPRPETQPNFDEFMGEIREKLSNALGLGIASILKRHPLAVAELPDPFRNLGLDTADFRLVLIINGHQNAWLAPLQDALRRELHPVIKTWALGPNAVIAINHERAKQLGLTSAP
jgi:hypothetical protein